MSRIHDALRKAEREKASVGGLEPAAQLAETAGLEVPQPPLPAVDSGTLVGRPKMADAVDPARLEEKLLAECPQVPWNPDKKTMLFFDEQNHAIGTEQFRSLRSHLYLMRKELVLKKVLVTSPLPREGKTFVAGNLAQVLARQQGRRVLVVDGDLRRSGMHECFGAPSAPGLSDYLAGDADSLQFVQRGPLENLFFIPAGKPVSNPLELIGSGRLKILLDRLAPAFDWIILDSPPATMVSDAKLLADVCDGVLMVVMAAVTPFDLAQKGCQELSGKRILGVVLNRAQGDAAYRSFKYYDNPKHRKKLETSLKQ
jgi:protein-tyrosine kinase